MRKNKDYKNRGNKKSRERRKDNKKNNCKI